jgi:hypothetical protein
MRAESGPCGQGFFGGGYYGKLLEVFYGALKWWVLPSCAAIYRCGGGGVLLERA